MHVGAKALYLSPSQLYEKKRDSSEESLVLCLYRPGKFTDSKHSKLPGEQSIPYLKDKPHHIDKAASPFLLLMTKRIGEADPLYHEGQIRRGKK